MAEAEKNKPISILYPPGICLHQGQLSRRRIADSMIKPMLSFISGSCPRTLA
jgi:hypothetical protein